MPSRMPVSASIVSQEKKVGADTPGVTNHWNTTALLLGLGGGVLSFDLVTKTIVSRTFLLGQSRELLDGLVRLTYIHNRGAIFGISIGQSTGTVVLIISLLAAIFLTIYYFRLPHQLKLYRFGLVLIISGAVGNLYDRIMFGEVRDFIDLGLKDLRWPIFNVADMAVTAGAILLAVELFRDRKTDQSSGVSAE